MSIYINTDILNKNINEIEQVPTRKGFGEGLLEAGKKDNRIYGLCGDLTESTQMHLFKEAFPKRFVEIGIAEQNMASVASGIAAMGKIPVISSYAMFSPGRNWEQIRTTICYNDKKVIIAGNHSGFSPGPDGGTHQALEDIALMRVLPRMTVICPADAIESRKAILASSLDSQKESVYIRLCREKTPILTKEETVFEIGKGIIAYKSDDIENHHSSDILFCSTGIMLYNTILSAKEIEEKFNKKVIVLHFHTIKPFDQELLLKYAKHTLKIVTVEEHQINCGFGSLVSEIISEKCPRHIVRIGVNDRYGQSGNYEDLFKEYELDIKSIIKKSLL